MKREQTALKLQNIPIRSELGRKIRQGFFAASSKVFSNFDYSEIELRKER